MKNFIFCAVALFEFSIDKQHRKHSIYDKIFVYFDVFKLLLNLQESLYTSTNLRHLTKT